jgi:hypothetical protein
MSTCHVQPRSNITALSITCISALSLCTVHLRCPSALSTCAAHRHCPPALSTCTVHLHCPPELSPCTVHLHCPPALSTSSVHLIWSPVLSTCTLNPHLANLRCPFTLCEFTVLYLCLLHCPTARPTFFFWLHCPFSCLHTCIVPVPATALCPLFVSICTSANSKSVFFFQFSSYPLFSATFPYRTCPNTVQKCLVCIVPVQCTYSIYFLLYVLFGSGSESAWIVIDYSRLDPDPDLGGQK